MKTSTLKSILITLLVALVIYVTVTPIAIWQAVEYKKQYEALLEYELEQFILNNDSIDYVQQ